MTTLNPAVHPLAKKYRSLIWSFLDCDLTRTALFYAERYFYTDTNNHDARHLLATSLLRCGQVHSASNVVMKERGCAGCMEVHAQCCTRLGRYRQAEDTLKLCMSLDRMSIGQCPEIDQVIRPPAAPLFPAPVTGHVRFTDPSPVKPPLVPSIPQKPDSHFFTPITNGPSAPSALLYKPSLDGYLPSFPFQQLDALRHDPTLNGRESLATVDSSFMGDVTFAQQSHGAVPTAGFLSKTNDVRPSHKRTRVQMNTGATVPKPEKKPSRGEGALAVFRRSTRLLGGASKNPVKAPPRERRRTRTRSRSRDPDDMDEDMQPLESTSSTSSAVHSPREFSPGPVLQPPDEGMMAANAILDLVRRFAKIVRALSLYEPQAAIEQILELPQEQTKAPWVSSLVGRARFEMADYVQASRAFEQARNLDPYRMWDMDVYSTVLWHLQKDVSLSFLAQELVSINDSAAQAWIATGNCFSLQKDHSQALTCFKRATQLDPRCAYGYALSGHEAMAMDDQESALQFFRTALKVDARHYPAWYGLGTVYLKQNKLRKAEYHFRKAVEISPSNAVLISCEGTVLEKRGMLEAALERFNRSLALAPTSSYVKWKRVKVLQSLKQYENALKDLLELRDISPDEANVAFTLGKLYRDMKRNVDATKCFTVARDLDPKLSAIVGHLMEEMANE
ncbi:anaphase-promoting complex subunit cdc27 [Tulasnella sp. 403]|nr:anaphase-promoting complex subunit cdc27 [Tulasnella sp. 403]